MTSPVPKTRSRNRTFLILGLCGLCASCATKPLLYEGLSSSRQLFPSDPRADRRIAFETALDASKLSSYSSISLQEVQIYRGDDNQFGKLSETAKADLARYAHVQFTNELANRQILAFGTQNRALEMKITITGAQSNIPILSTATRVTPVGFALAGLQLAGDREGTLTGAVTYAVELFDPAGGLVYAFVTRQYPNALNIPATILPLNAAKAGIDRGAKTTATALKKLLNSGR